jgi:hypothetical protein
MQRGKTNDHILCCTCPSIYCRSVGWSCVTFVPITELSLKAVTNQDQWCLQDVAQVSLQNSKTMFDKKGLFAELFEKGLFDKNGILLDGLNGSRGRLFDDKV